MKKPRKIRGLRAIATKSDLAKWRGQDLNLRPRGYEPRELPGCSTPRQTAGRDISQSCRAGMELYTRFARGKVARGRISKDPGDGHRSGG